jgi:hypothetical protein
MKKIDIFYNFIDKPTENELLNVFLNQNFIPYQIITTIIDKEQMKNFIYNTDISSSSSKLSEILTNRLKENNVEQYKIDICTKKLKGLIKIFYQYERPNKCIGNEIFKDIVKMAYEMNFYNTIKDKVKSKLSFQKISNLINSNPIIPTLSSNFLHMNTKGVDLSYYMINEIDKFNKSYTNFYLYKPQSNLYTLRLEFFIRNKNNQDNEPNDIFNKYIFHYNKDKPTFDSIKEWVLDKITSTIYDEYLHNDIIINIFKSKNISTKKNKKDNLDNLQWIDDSIWSS